MKTNTTKSTTIIGIRKGNEVVIAGDGQASLGATIIKTKVKKVRRLGKDGAVIVGFAGSTADAFALFERLESKLEKHPGQLQRACVELAKDWRTDRYLRSLLISGTGDVIESDDGILGIGSGGPYAISAAKALIDDSKLSASNVAEKALNIAADICVYTNHNIVSEKIEI